MVFSPTDPTPDYAPDHAPVKPSRASEKVYNAKPRFAGMVDGKATYFTPMYSIRNLMSQARS